MLNRNNTADKDNRLQNGKNVCSIWNKEELSEINLVLQIKVKKTSVSSGQIEKVMNRQFTKIEI